MKPITHEEAAKFLNNNAPEKPERNTRVITVTITGPEAGPIAAGMSIALAQIAQDIESRHKNTGVRVSASPKVETPADSTAKAPK